VKTETEKYKAKLLSKDRKILVAAINQLAKSGNKKEVEFLIGMVFKNRPPNGVTIALRVIGNSRNKNGIQALIESYGDASHDERQLIMECLLKLEVFSHFFSGIQTAKNIQDRLWPLLFPLKSSQLKEVLALSPEKFAERLEFAWRTTKHWRK
jgi:hypothetical protein